MASLDCYLPTGNWRIRFRFGYRQFHLSLDTTEESHAQYRKAQVEETISLLKRGILTLPTNVGYDEAARFILTGGKITAVTTPVYKHTLGEVCKIYFDELPQGGKAKSTVHTEGIHTDHFRRLLGQHTLFESLGTAELQSYVKKREKEEGQRPGTVVQPETIKKEMGTFSVLWTFAKSRGWVSGDCPKRGVILSKSDEKPPFMTWDQIVEAIQGGASEDLWDRLFLDERQVWELIDFVKVHGNRPALYPMVAFVALTGARLSEILRSERGDFLWDQRIVLVREKKRKQKKAETTRPAPLFPELATIIREWFSEKHPGGRYTICDNPDVPLTGDAADKLLDRTLANSKWSILRGWHTLRHSFISICASKKTPQSLIDTWVGHQTDEQRRRYQHLFPERVQEAMNGLFRRA